MITEEKSKWIIKLANKAYEIPLCRLEFNSKPSKVGNIKDELV